MTPFLCRSCGSDNIYPFLDLGLHPHSDGLLKQADEPEDVYPLKTVLCEDCTLVQITETVDPVILFANDYPYYSSFSPYLLEHSRRNVKDLIYERDLGPDNLVIEVASNDGYLLKNYVEAGVPVLGIDPAESQVQAANKIGVTSVCEFFGREYAETLAADGVVADVIHGNNVLAHVADTNGFVAGLATVLADDGVVVIEAPYVRDLITHVEFDTIYHQHLCYFSATSFKNLFARHGLYLNDVTWLPIHGGSLRYFASKSEGASEDLSALLAEERSIGIGTREYYSDFADRVVELKDNLVTLVDQLRADGSSLAAYGAAAKGATLLNYTGIGTDVLDFVVDRNVHKIGKFMPGQRIPIREVDALLAEQPDYVLVLAWNFIDEIANQQHEYLARGGQFIRPVPTPEIIEASP